MALRKSSADVAAMSSADLSRGMPGAASATAGARTLKGGGGFAAAAGFLTAAFGDFLGVGLMATFGFAAAAPLAPFLAGGAAPLPWLLAPRGVFANRACSCRAIALRMRTISDSSLAGGSVVAGGKTEAGFRAGCWETGARCGVSESESPPNWMTKGGSSALLGRAAAANDGTTAANALTPAGGASRGSK